MQTATNSSSSSAMKPAANAGVITNDSLTATAVHATLLWHHRVSEKGHVMKSKLHMCAVDLPVSKAHLGVPMHSLCLVLNGANAMIIALCNMVLGLSQVLCLAEQLESFLQEISTDWETGCITKHKCRWSKPVQVCVKQKATKIAFWQFRSGCCTSCYSMTDMVTGQTVDGSGVNANNSATTDTIQFWAFLLPLRSASCQVLSLQWQNWMQGGVAANKKAFDLPYSSPSCQCHSHTSLQASAVLQQHPLQNTEESNTSLLNCNRCMYSKH